MWNLLLFWFALSALLSPFVGAFVGGRVRPSDKC